MVRVHSSLPFILITLDLRRETQLSQVGAQLATGDQNRKSHRIAVQSRFSRGHTVRGWWARREILLLDTGA